MCLFLLARDTVTEYHMLGGLKKQIVTVPQLRRPEVPEQSLGRAGSFRGGEGGPAPGLSPFPIDDHLLSVSLQVTFSLCMPVTLCPHIFLRTPVVLA